MKFCNGKCRALLLEEYLQAPGRAGASLLESSSAEKSPGNPGGPEMHPYGKDHQ